MLSGVVKCSQVLSGVVKCSQVLSSVVICCQVLSGMVICYQKCQVWSVIVKCSEDSQLLPDSQNSSDFEKNQSMTMPDYS